MDDYSEQYKNKKVFYVTTLSDEGEGSIREIIKDKTPKIILFKVSGVIELKKRLWIGNPHIVIDGSSAPGPIIFIGELFYIRTHDVMVRYITVASNRHELVIDSVWITLSFNVILDHVTALFGSDETLSVTKSDYVIISNCIIGNTLNVNKHAFGSLLNGEDDTSVIIFKNNLIANCTSRNPAFGYGCHIMSNNLIYNYGYRATYTSYTGNSNVMMLNNYFKPGPNTTIPNIIFRMPDRISEVTLFVDNNFIEGFEEETKNNLKAVSKFENGLSLDYDGKNIKIKPDEYLSDLNNLKKKDRNKVKKIIKKKLKIFNKLSKTTYIKKEMDRIDYFQNYYNILNYVGNSIHRSYLDDKIIQQVRSNTGEHASFNEIKLDEIIKVVHDKDGDGIPDEVEDEFGLDKYNNIDGEFIDENGEINIYKYLKSFAKKNKNPEFYTP